ncbi:MAG: methylmalonyl Co-A mutase-associated GTPase MeaB [Candidatus Kapabacteria bacterium]|nr:methylmalonyl Co-A mutase-associated GTPase MeaB [Ignavibacteriota bacterium]MCW5885293.1 methylmalonyl Co-A mutase-associated GTPase MeaB [Candidatus Kapabacteria bacterium]
MSNKKKPEWVPEKGGDEFASSVMPGVSINQVHKYKVVKRKTLNVEDFVRGVLESNTVILSKAITLIESNNEKHTELTQSVIKELLPYSGKSVRIGITGPPGAGKSTFIESLGMFLCKNGFKVAVLAVDPSSTVSGGSILGDKTRMEYLSREHHAYIRPSPSGGTLGGVARKTRETILVCEAAGYDVILIETIGVGQSEVTVRSMVDFFLLLLLPGSGDELQGIKKGVVELADSIVINKAEGNYKDRANLTKASYSNALRLLTSATEGWIPKAMTCSALNNDGIEEVWSVINEFMINTKDSGIFEKRRNEQLINWVNSMVEDEVHRRFFGNSEIRKLRSELENRVLSAEVTPTQAVNLLIKKYFGEK